VSKPDIEDFEIANAREVFQFLGIEIPERPSELIQNQAVASLPAKFVALPKKNVRFRQVPLTVEQPRSLAPQTRQSDSKCQRSKACKSDDEWDRIFAAKFADPEYYSFNLRSRSPVAE
jgi:hypothetical protein